VSTSAGQEAYQIVRNTIAAIVFLHYSSKVARVVQRDGLKKTLCKQTAKCIV
jgi:hypothetical protein